MIELTELVSKVNGTINPTGHDSEDEKVLKNIENLGEMLCNYVKVLHGIKSGYSKSTCDSVVKCRNKAEYYLDEIRDILGYE